MSKETETFIKLVCRLHREHERDEDCKLIDWLQQQGDNFKSVDDLRQAMVERKEWNAGFGVPTLIDVKKLYPHDEEECDRIQMVYAKAILRDDPKFARGFVERAIRDHGDMIEDGAMKILIGWLAEHHPNPKAFVMRHLHHVPEHVMLTNLPSPDFPHLEGQHLRGERSSKSKRKAERLAKAAQGKEPA